MKTLSHVNQSNSKQLKWQLNWKTIQNVEFQTWAQSRSKYLNNKFAHTVQYNNSTKLLNIFYFWTNVQNAMYTYTEVNWGRENNFLLIKIFLLLVLILWC